MRSNVDPRDQGVPNAPEVQPQGAVNSGMLSEGWVKG